MAKPAGYYNALLNGTPDDVISLMKRYSIHPPDHANAYTGTKVRDAKDARTTPEGKSVDVELAVVDTPKRIAYLDFNKAPKGQLAVTGNEGAGTIYANASYTPNPAHVPVYWLPWNTAGAIVALKIPQKGAGIGGQPDPDLFFTAAINGCSVFFKGPANSPTIYHAGGDTYQTTMSGGADFWRNLLNTVGTGFAAEVNKTDYIKADGIRGSTGLLTTQSAKDYETWLATDTSNSLHIEDVSPWGCVMGIRRGNNWSFYLQENVTIKYTVLKKKYGLVGSRVPEREKKVQRHGTSIVAATSGPKNKRIVVDRIRMVSHPIRFREVFPTGLGSVRMFMPLPKAKHG